MNAFQPLYDLEQSSPEIYDVLSFHGWRCYPKVFLQGSLVRVLENNVVADALSIASIETNHIACIS